MSSLSHHPNQTLSQDQIDDLRFAATKMTGANRRSFMAEMALKYCNGSARQAETVFGWSRHSVTVGLSEKRTGIICIGAQSAYCGNKLWEDKHPEAAVALRELAESHSQQDPTFRTSVTYTRLTAQSALESLRKKGFSDDDLPSASTMSEILNRMGYRLRKVLKAKPKKKIKETDAIFNNIKEKDEEGKESVNIKRLSMDCKATVKIGNFSRGGQTRGDCLADDHDFGCQEKYIPCGILDEDKGQLNITFGSSYKTSDFIVDSLSSWWYDLDKQEQQDIDQIQIKMDNGPESSGVRTQFLKRMVVFSDDIGKPVQLLYYPPYHSKYNPIERCWGILEMHWNGAKLVDVNTMLQWAKSMTWKGLKPIVKISHKVYKKGISLSKAVMRTIEKRLKRSSTLPKWDIFISPATVI